MKFSEYIYNRLKNLGYTGVFGVPGSYIQPIWQSMIGDPKVILSRHESGAAFMADGWARITNKPGVVLTTTGPGITNVVTGIACAFRDSIPMLVITGQASLDMSNRGTFQESFSTDRGFSPHSLMSNVTKASIEISHINNAVFLFEKALKLSISGRKGPVHLSIPVNIQTQEIADKDINILKNKLNLTHLNEENITFEKLRNSRRTLIIAGWGCHLSGVSDYLKIVSEKLGAPIVSTVKGMTACNYDWSLYLGYLGPGEKQEVVDFIKEYDPDLVLILGASLASFYSNRIKDTLNKADCIQVDISDDSIGSFHRIDYGIQSDLKEWLPLVINQLETKTKDYKEVEKEISKLKLSIDKKVWIYVNILDTNKLSFY